MTLTGKKFMRRIQNIHFVGIGGAGMGGIAEVFHNLGYHITGSDIAENSMVKRLRGLGVDVLLGHDAVHIASAHVVVVSTAIDDRNPEVEAARKLRIPIVRRAEMLAELMRFRRGIAVAGTHGKTTTTSLVASALAAGDIDPTYVIGGLLNSSASHARLGASDYLVAEADESDASFLYLQPMMAIVTNIDQDHLSTYEGDFDRLKQTFVEFLHHLPFYGLAVVCIDDPVVREVVTSIARPVLSYGESEDADVQITSIRAEAARTHFTLLLPGIRDEQHFAVNLPGRHNVLNATAAICIANELEVPIETTAKALSEFSGIGRRCQITDDVRVGDVNVMHIDDYGHHPNEIRATVSGIREAWPERNLTVAFQPHRFSRTRDLFEDFVQVLSEVDRLILLEVYAAGEKHIKDADSRALARSIRSRGQVDPVFVEGPQDIDDVLSTMLQDGDIFLTLGAGSIGAWANEFVSSHTAGGAR